MGAKKLGVISLHLRLLGIEERATTIATDSVSIFAGKKAEKGHGDNLQVER